MKPGDVTDAEFAILSALWRQGEMTTREIAQTIYRDVSSAKMASVQKLIERLEGKSMVHRERGGRAHRFSASISQDQFIALRMQNLANQFSDGELVPLVTSLLRHQGVSREEGAALRKLIDELWPEKKKSR